MKVREDANLTQETKSMINRVVKRETEADTGSDRPLYCYECFIKNKEERAPLEKQNQD